MKILHTADWHLGHTLYGYDRTEEQHSMLEQIVAIAQEQQPDVFLLSGDVYDTSQPSAAVQAMFNSTIARLHTICPDTTIVITAGNHDSGSRHEIFSVPWKYLNVYMIGTLNKANLPSHIIHIPHKGYVVAVPYTHERNLQDGLFQQLLDMVAEQNTDNLPVVLSAHTSVAGADFSGHENATEKTIGGIDTIDVKNVGRGYDYLALGHIHHAQFVHTGRHNVRYSGSPLPVSFDEAYQHSVSIVDIQGKGEQPQVSVINIVNPRPLITFPQEGFASWEQTKSWLRLLPADNKCYIRLNVDIQEGLASATRQEALLLIEDKQCRLCVFNVPRHSTASFATNQVSVQEFRRMQPIEVARMYANDLGAVFDERMAQMFAEVQRLAEQEEREV